jgi:hypothetical protein
MRKVLMLLVAGAMLSGVAAYVAAARAPAEETGRR